MICAVIVSYNSEKIFRCYESIKEQVDFTIIVDNATQDGGIISKLKLLEKDNVKLVFNAENIGIASALNTGIEFAKEKNCDWLITLDQDSELSPSTVNDMMNEYGALPENIKEKTAVLGCKYIERSFQNPEKNNTNKELFKINNLMVTSGNFLKIKALEKTGGFTEKLFIYCVDLEFYYRVLKAGFLNLEAQNVFIIHEFGQSQKKLGFHITNQSPIKRYYISRNGIYFFKEFVFFKPYRAFRVMIGSTLGGMVKITLFEKNKLTKFKYIIEGIFDGIINRYGKKYNP
jgi:Predicted glycosyltransferases